MNIYRNKREKVITYIVFFIYLFLLCWLVLFKFAVSVDGIPHHRGINLIPFYYDRASPVHMREVILNIIVFIPAGFYFTAIFSKKRYFLGIVKVVILSLSFEVLQYIFSIGASDITDLITNTTGGLCGMTLFWLMGKITIKHRMIIINSLGAMIEILAGIILAVTFL